MERGTKRRGPGIPLPREHGAWAMVLAPALAGLSVGRPLWPDAALLLLGLLAAFSAQYVVVRLLTAKRIEPGLRPAGGVYLAVTIASGAALLLRGHVDLLPLVTVAAIYFGVHLWMVQRPGRREHRHLAFETLTVAVLCLGAVAGALVAGVPWDAPVHGRTETAALGTAHPAPGSTTDGTHASHAAPGAPTEATDASHAAPGAPTEATDASHAAPGAPTEATDASHATPGVPTEATDASRAAPGAPHGPPLLLGGTYAAAFAFFVGSVFHVRALVRRLRWKPPTLGAAGRWRLARESIVWHLALVVGGIGIGVASPDLLGRYALAFGPAVARALWTVVVLDRPRWSLRDIGLIELACTITWLAGCWSWPA